MGHHRVAASASSRWLVCQGSIALIEALRAAKKIPESRTNDAAERGTAVHYIVEQVLLGNNKASDFKGKVLKVDGMTKGFKMESNDIKGARIQIKYVQKQLRKNPKLKMFPEKKYDLTDIYKIPTGGTADVTMIEMYKELEIDDYKNGRWPVEVVGNTQMRIYALGAYYKFHEKYKFKKVKLTICQPNCYLDPIRSEKLSIKKLIKWEREVLVPALENIKSGRGKLVPDEDKQCVWCDAKAHCPARKANKPKMVRDIIQHIIPVTDMNTLPDPEILSEEELNNALQNADKVIKFYTDCKKYALKQLEDDSSCISGWDTIPKLGNRRFIEDKSFKKKLRSKKIPVKDVTMHLDRLMTVTELESYLKHELEWDKDKVKLFMEEVTERPKSGRVLQKVETAESDFAEFVKQETKKPKTKKRRNRRK